MSFHTMHQQPGTDRAAAAYASRRAAVEGIAIAAAMFLVTAASTLGAWFGARGVVTDNYRHYLIGLASMAATMVRTESHQTLVRPEQTNSPGYDSVIEPLRRMQAAIPDIHYIYTLVTDGHRVRFVLDTGDPHQHTRAGIPDQSMIGDAYEHGSPALREALGEVQSPGRPSADLEPTSDEWGTFMTGLAPLRDAGGREIGVVGVDIDATHYLALLDHSRARLIAGAIPSTALIGLFGILFYVVRRRGLTAARAAYLGEQRARQAAEALAHERQKLHAVVEATDVGTWDWVRGERLVRIDTRWTSILGLEPDCVALTLRQIRSLIHPLDRASVGRALIASIRRRESIFVHDFRMRHRGGYWVWVLARGKLVSAQESREPEHFSGVIMDVSSRKAMEVALLAAAQRDRLTGLANRAIFMERLDTALDRVRAGAQTQVAVLFLDFDRFKLINDTLGHATGDELIRQIAERLRAALRDRDASEDPAGNLICRFGGDEFLVLLNDLHRPQEAVAVAERLLNTLSQPYTVKEVEVFSTASIGIVTSGTGAASAVEIVRNADVAMYEAKRAGRGCSVVFDETMHERLARHMTIETSLRRAIANEELYLEYQPIVDLASGRCVHVEALLRWRHPVLGVVSPNEFIPVAEDSGLIVPVGQWVLEESCRAMAHWRKTAPQSTPSLISVNVSRQELALGRQFTERVIRVLQNHGLAPQLLQLEVTEREVVHESAATLTALQDLRGAGIKLAMDDFGTGTSSLSALRGYPFHTIKIDRAFLKDLRQSREVMSVIHATIMLIQNLGMLAVAEGVEDEIDVAMLQSLGCDLAQGYHFSLPLSRDDTAAFFGRRAITSHRE